MGSSIVDHTGTNGGHQLKCGLKGGFPFSRRVFHATKYVIGKHTIDDVEPAISTRLNVFDEIRKTGRAEARLGLGKCGIDITLTMRFLQQ